MNTQFILDGKKFGIPFHKYTGWTLERVMKHKDGMAFLRETMKTLESMPKLRPELVELHDELKLVPGI